MSAGKNENAPCITDDKDRRLLSLTSKFCKTGEKC
jgi:hypothetical protein